MHTHILMENYYLFCDMDLCAGSRHLIKPVMKNHLLILKWVPGRGDLHGCHFLVNILLQ